MRTNDDDRYFSDTYQLMPAHGFTRLFENMLDHPNIKVMLNADYRDVIYEIAYDRMIYTGPVDEFFEFRYGKLPYRSLKFHNETIDCEQFQPVATVNYPSEEVPYTRVTEHKHLTGRFIPRRRSPTNSRAPKATRIIQCRVRKTLSFTRSTKRSRMRSSVSTSSGVWRHTSTTTWTR